MYIMGQEGGESTGEERMEEARAKSDSTLLRSQEGCSQVRLRALWWGATSAEGKIKVG